MTRAISAPGPYRGNVSEAEFLNDELALRALAAGGRAGDDQLDGPRGHAHGAGLARGAGGGGLGSSGQGPRETGWDSLYFRLETSRHTHAHLAQLVG